MFLNSIRDLIELLHLFPERYRTIKFGIFLGFFSGVLIVCGYASAAISLFSILQVSVENVPFIILRWIFLGFICLLLGFYCRHKAANITHDALFHLEVDLREDLAQRIAQIPMGEINNQGTSSLKKIIFDDVKALHAAVADASSFIGVVFGQPLTVLVILLVVQWKLFIAICVMLGVLQVCMKMMMHDFIPQERRYNQAAENTNLAVIEFVQGMPVVRTFDSDQIGWRRFASRIHEFTDAASDWIRTTKLSNQLLDIFSNVLPSFAVIVAVSVLLLMYHQISLNDMIIGLMIGTLPVQAFKPFSILLHLLFDSRAAVRCILKLYTIPRSMEPTQPQIPKSFDLNFVHVNFSYNTERQILRNITFAVAQGTSCALVGASGSGKTTLSRLIARFYDNYSGDIQIGGINIRDITSAELLRKVAFIFQEPFLIADSIAENIRLYQPNASIERVEKAAMAVNLHAFITSLPEGYDTLVGEKGGKLSGGQRQRITIARALLSEAQIFIIDEATASVDSENEAEINQSLNRLTKGKTVIKIAHRLATIKHCDQIVVMDKGQIVGVGDHEQLLKDCSRYINLWEHYHRAANWSLESSRGELC